MFLCDLTVMPYGVEASMLDYTRAFSPTFWSSFCNMQIRVMPKCWFVLLRFWLRVDDTLLRIREARYFCELHKGDIVLREIKQVEGTFDDLAKAGAPSSNVRVAR